MAFDKKPAKKKRASLPAGRKSLSDFRKMFSEKIVDISVYDKVEVIPTGSIILDDVTGIGGYPRGRITELWGEEGVSKTTLALHAVAECQKLGMAAAYFDFEGAFSNQYARDIGVNIDDTDKFLFFEPTSFEDAEAALQEIPQVDNVGLVVIDSVSAMTPESHYEGGATIGLLARKLSQFLSVFVKVLRKNGAACIAVNQIRMKIATNKFEKTVEYSTGGKALQFYNSVKIKLKTSVKEKEEVTDPLTLKVREIARKVKVKAEVTKNKFAKPFAFGEYWVRYGAGVDNGASIFDMALAHEILEQSGSWIKFSFPWNGKAAGDFKVQGEDKVREMLCKDSSLQRACVKIMTERGVLQMSKTDIDSALLEEPRLSVNEDDDEVIQL